jgi:hypothetical protein
MINRFDIVMACRFVAKAYCQDIAPTNQPQSHDVLIRKGSQISKYSDAAVRACCTDMSDQLFEILPGLFDSCREDDSLLTPVTRLK